MDSNNHQNIDAMFPMVVVSVAEECDLGLRHMTIPIVIFIFCIRSLQTCTFYANQVTLRKSKLDIWRTYLYIQGMQYVSSAYSPNHLS